MLKQRCRFYNSTRRCRYGEACRFSHESEKTVAETDSVAGCKIEKSTISETAITQNSEMAENSPSHDIAAIELEDGKGGSATQNASPEQSAVKICEFYTKYNYCKFGKRCRFRHIQGANSSTSKSKTNNNQKKTLKVKATTEENVEDNGIEKEQNGKLQSQLEKRAPKKICHLFKKGSCKFGKRCRYLHTNATEDGKHDTSKQEIGTQNPPPLDKTVVKDSPTELSVSENKSCIKTTKSINTVPRRPVVQPPRVIYVYKRSEVTNEQLLELRKTEITQLKKRFPSDRLQTLEESDQIARFVFTFQPTDPDWPFDVKIFEIQVTIPEQYPLKRFLVALPCEQDLPETVRRYIEVTLEDWLSEKEYERMAKDCVELSFRPFLRWLDKNMEEIVTEALKQLHRELTAQAAGLQFIPAGKPQHYPKQQQASSDPDQASCSDREHPEEPDLIFYKKGEVEEEVYMGPRSHVDDSSDDTDEDTSDDDDDGDDHDGDEGDDKNGGNSKDSDRPRTSVGHQRPKIPLDTPRQGTEMCFRRLQLWNIATILVEKLRLSVQCERCKHNTDFTTPPDRVNSVPCAKCHAAQFVVFRPVLAHAYGSTFGYLDMDGCSPIEVILQSCHMSVGCANCSIDMLVKSFSPGRMMEFYCRGCHNKIKFAAESVKLTNLAPSGLETISGKVYDVKVNSLRRVQKDPAIQEGRSLPDNGACKHYKKSFRWIRFPCCGKSYPCDVCHDSKEDHEMKFANRMICGFCCKEQPYASEKPCVACSSALTKVRSSHWEGGRGCRDKISMSRSDNKKYANMNKTTSTKAKQLQEKHKGKKNTKLRHS